MPFYNTVFFLFFRGCLRTRDCQAPGKALVSGLPPGGRERWNLFYWGGIQPYGETRQVDWKQCFVNETQIFSPI